MAITDKTEGVWVLDEVYNKQNQGGIWSYSGVASLFVWGKNTHGLLGQNNLTSYSSPVQVPGTTWKYLSHTASSSNDTDFSLATKTDGTLWAWGANGNGELGQNSEVKRSSPIQIPGTTWGQYMETTGGSVFSLRTDGTLWAWGRNTSGYGRLGLNDKNSRSSPTQIPGTWSNINANGFATMATKTDGTLWTWGNSNVGQLGLNGPVNTNYSSPKQVGTDTTWSTSMAGGGNWQTAIKTDGTLWIWGYNNKGQLGLNENGGPGAGLSGAKSSPVQIGTATTWSKITSTNSSAVAIKTDGTLWSWGQNNQGQLGINNEADRSSPTQVPGTTWANVLSAQNSTIAVKTDATLWSWGYNNYGNLGLNNQTYYSSPTQIVGDWRQGVREMGATWGGFMVIKDL